MPLSAATAFAFGRLMIRLWVALDGPNAMRLHRLVAVVTLCVIATGAYWAMETRTSIGQRMDAYERKLDTAETAAAEMLRPRDEQLAALDRASRGFDHFVVESQSRELVMAQRMDSIARDVAEARDQLSFLTRELLRNKRADSVPLRFLEDRDRDARAAP